MVQEFILELSALEKKEVGVREAGELLEDSLLNVHESATTAKGSVAISLGVSSAKEDNKGIQERRGVLVLRMEHFEGEEDDLLCETDIRGAGGDDGGDERRERHCAFVVEEHEVTQIRRENRLDMALMESQAVEQVSYLLEEEFVVSGSVVQRPHEREQLGGEM